MQAEPDRDDARAADTARRELRKGLLIVGVHLAAAGAALGVALWIGADRHMPPPPPAAMQTARLTASPSGPDDGESVHAIGRDARQGDLSSRADSATFAGAAAEAGFQAGLPMRVELPAPWFVDTDGRVHARDR